MLRTRRASSKAISFRRRTWRRVEGQNAFPGNGEKRNNGAAQALCREHAAILNAIKIRARGF